MDPLQPLILHVNQRKFCFLNGINKVFVASLLLKQKHVTAGSLTLSWRRREATQVDCLSFLQRLDHSVEPLHPKIQQFPTVSNIMMVFVSIHIVGMFHIVESRLPKVRTSSYTLRLRLVQRHTKVHENVTDQIIRFVYLT